MRAHGHSRAQVAALETAQIASEAERTEVHEEVKALRTALKVAESDARRLEALAGERAASITSKQ